MCIVTVMNHGLRNGGGVGDILRKPSKDVSTPARSQTCGAQATVPISKCGESLASHQIFRVEPPPPNLYPLFSAFHTWPIP